MSTDISQKQKEADQSEVVTRTHTHTNKAHEDHLHIYVVINLSITIRAAEGNCFVQSGYERDGSLLFMWMKIRLAKDKHQTWKISHAAIWSDTESVYSEATINKLQLHSLL